MTEAFLTTGENDHNFNDSNEDQGSYVPNIFKNRKASPYAKHLMSTQQRFETLFGTN
jgi:hypothetical protein